jgi:hypothetical protein
LLSGNEIITATKAESALAKKSSRKIAAYFRKAAKLRLELKSDDSSEGLVLPRSVVRVLVRVLDEMGQGNAVTLTPLRAELTTQHAADLLNVSRPYLVKLLDGSRRQHRLAGEVPSRSRAATDPTGATATPPRRRPRVSAS